MSGVYNAMDTHTHISDFRLSLFHPIPCIVDNAILGSLCIQYSIFFGHGMGSCIEWMHSERVKEKKKCTLDDNSKPPAQGNKMNVFSCLGRFSNTLLGDSVLPTSPVKTSPGVL